MAWVNPYPTHGVLLPATPWVYPSKIAQKCPKRPRIEGDRANFNEFSEISHISFSFGPKNTFWACSKAHGYRYHNPYPYPAVPRPITRAGDRLALSLGHVTNHFRIFSIFILHIHLPSYSIYHVFDIQLLPISPIPADITDLVTDITDLLPNIPTLPT